MGVTLKLHIEKGFLGKVRKVAVRAHGVLGCMIPLLAWVQFLFGGIASQGFCRGEHMGQVFGAFHYGLCVYWGIGDCSHGSAA